MTEVYRLQEKLQDFYVEKVLFAVSWGDMKLPPNKENGDENAFHYNDSHNGCDSISNHQSHDRLLNRLFRCRSKKTSKLHVTGLCAGNTPGTGEFPAPMASNAENVSIWWRPHANVVLIVGNGLMGFF